MTGDLTLHGIAKPATLLDFTTTGSLKRRDFDITRFLPAISDQVDIVTEFSGPK